MHGHKAESSPRVAVQEDDGEMARCASELIPQEAVQGDDELNGRNGENGPKESDCGMQGRNAESGPLDSLDHFRRYAGDLL